MRSINEVHGYRPTPPFPFHHGGTEKPTLFVFSVLSPCPPCLRGKRWGGGAACPSQIRLVLPAIDDEANARDPARPHGHQEGHGVGDLLRSAHPAPRDGLEN